MTRTKEIAGKVERLQSALKRAEILDPDSVLDAQPMCDLVGFSWPIVKGWCNDNPVLEKPELFKRGGNGIKWQFKPVPFISALLDLFLADAEAKTEANAELRRKLGVDLPATEQAASMDDTRKLIGATLELNKARIEQKEFTPSQKFYDLFGEFVKDTVEGIMGLGIAVDPTGNLSPEAHELIDYHQRALSSHLHQKWSKRIELERASLEQSRII